MTMDVSSFGDAFARPGMDPRQWVSYGTVDEDTEDQHSVRFADDDGNPLPTGPLVTVTLQPSGITVVCRVASFVAGVGEGTWYPIQQKDEVLVLLPQGDEMAGPVIVGRLNQALDEWPSTVAGQDATQNNFGFWRLRTPFVIESAEAFLIRSAKTGSQIGIDGEGQVVLNNGDRNNVFIGSDAISISSGDDDTFLQLNFTERRITAATGDSRFELSASGESILHATGALNIGSAGARGKGHALSSEQIIAWLSNVISQLALAGAFNPLSPYGAAAWTVPGAAVTALNALFAAVIPAQVSPAPFGTSGVPGGNFAPLASTLATLNFALASPLPAADPTGFILGVGRASLMY